VPGTTLFLTRTRLTSDRVLSQILEVLYEAPLDPSRWQEFLRLTAAVADGEAAALLMHDFSRTESLMSIEWGFHPEVARQYAAHYGAIDVWRAAVTASSDWLGTSEQFVPSASLARTEFYNDLLLPYEIPHGMFAMVERRSGRVANLSICRSAKKGPFDKNDLGILQLLKPHIQRAFRLHSELAAAHVRAGGLLHTLDAISTGVILLGLGMQVVTMNRRAEQIVASSNGLRVSRGQLMAESISESTRLQNLITQVAATSKGEGFDSGGAMMISRLHPPPLQVLVSPVRGLHLGSPNSVRAIVLVSDPARSTRPAYEALRAMFGLTSAEYRLAMLLSEGRTPSEIADRLAISQNTVKSQLASIYGKTGTSRQSQLMKLLLKIASPMIPIREMNRHQD
jgi:DNA-binding CsgD family transcriptional regulator